MRAQISQKTREKQQKHKQTGGGGHEKETPRVGEKPPSEIEYNLKTFHPDTDVVDLSFTGMQFRKKVRPPVFSPARVHRRRP